MKYALAKFRVYLLGSGPFVVYTDHASLRTAVKSPHISQRMARWLSFFTEYDFLVEYKPGRLNVVADALSRRPDYAVKTTDANRIGVERVSAPSSSLIDDVKAAYASDADAKQLLSYASAPSDEARRKLTPHLRARAHRYRVHEGLLLYSAVDDDVIRIVVPNDYDLRMRIMYEYHDAPTTGHPGREKTYVLLTRDFYWNHQYKWVRKYVRVCDVCQRVKPAAFSQAPLQSLPTPSECWQSISMDFVFGLPPDSKRRTGVVVFVDRFSKMVHLAAVPAEVTAAQTARLFVDMVFKHHGMPLDIVSDRDPRFTARFWQAVFTLLGTQLSMSTADHSQMDGQAERVNRVLGDLLKSYAHSFQQWSDCLPMAEFAINNSVHASTGHTSFYVNAMRHPRLPSMLGTVASSLSRGGSTVASEQLQESADTDSVSVMTTRREVESRSEQVSFISPFTVLEQHGNAYTLDIPSSMRLHPTFYVGRLKPYTQHEPPNLDGSQKTAKRRKPASRGQQHGRGASRPAIQVPLGCSTRSERPARPAPSGSAAPAANGQTPHSGTVLERLHGRVEHGSHGQPVVDRTRGIFPPPPPPLRDARGSTRWIVERIVGYEPPKTNRDQARLRIRWREFPPHRDTWEPRNVLIEDVPEMVRAYEAQNGVQA
ncbi:hypothetical protein Pcac1_g21695 [Phytophthora cactorum]|nr:hypothetical protein Pcac1_g21695 [Phytophthora cactorum]